MSEQKMKKRRSPQEKKKLSLKKDRPTSHSKSDKGGRVAKPRIKRQMNEKVRRKSKEVIRSSGFEDTVEIENKLAKVKREKWWKARPKTLGESIQNKKERRIREHGARKRRHERNLEYERDLAQRVAEVKKSEKYKNASEEKVFNVAFSMYLESKKKERKKE